MPTKNIRTLKMKKNNWDEFLAKLAIFISVLMIAGGAVGMILVQNEIKKSQDLRQQASVTDGKVTVVVGSDATPLNPDTEGKILFKINTAGVQTDGVQLTFNIVSEILPNPPVFNLINTAPLQLAYSEVETTTDGYLVSIIALPKTLGQPFSTNQLTDFGYLSLTPDKVGPITLNFDVENSISTVHASNPPKDELTHIGSTQFSVIESDTQCQTDADCSNGEYCYQPPMPECPAGVSCVQVMPQKVCQPLETSPSPSPSASPDACTKDLSGNIVCMEWDLMPGFCDGGKLIKQPTDECGCSMPPKCEYPDTSPSPSVSPSVSPSPSPSDDPGTGGVEVASCNESCSSNNDCAVNLRCYSGQCRLATNVTSQTCAAQPDQGLSFSCNEYCSDTNECAAGLVCQNNSCRNPENVESTTCADLTIAQRTSVVRSCNQSCSSNSQCDVNLRCYQGACRLATNPGSYSCTASTKKVVSNAVYGTKTKGSDNESTEPSAMGKTDPSKTTGSVKINDNDSDDMQDGAMTDKEDMMDNDGEETALDSVKNYFLANPKLPITLMGIGIGLVIAIIILALLKRRKNDDDMPPTPPMSSGMTSGGNKYEADLQNKINSLKKESLQPPKPSPVPPAMTPPPASPIGANRMPIPQNKPVEIGSKEVFSNENKPSSMLDRLKNKDITPPSV